MLIHPAPARAEGTSHLLLQHHSTDHNTVIHLVNAKPPHISGVDLFMGNLRRATGKKSKKCIKLYTASKFLEVLREESIVTLHHCTLTFQQFVLSLSVTLLNRLLTPTLGSSG